VAIALTSGIAAAEALVAGQSSSDYQRSFAGRSRRPLAIAGALRKAAESPRLRGSLMRLAPALAPLAARLTRIG